MEPLVIWLLWTFVGAAPQDVDSFLHEGQCKTLLQERRELLAQAIKQTDNEKLKKIRLYGCYPANATPPKPT